MEIYRLQIILYCSVCFGYHYASIMYALNLTRKSSKKFHFQIKSNYSGNPSIAYSIGTNASVLITGVILYYKGHLQVSLIQECPHFRMSSIEGFHWTYILVWIHVHTWIINNHSICSSQLYNIYMFIIHVYIHTNTLSMCL